MLQGVEVLGLNWAEMPTAWAAIEAQEHAHRRGHSAVGSDDLLLGVLATHEVAFASPPVLLPPEADRLYAGGHILAASGVSYQTAREVADRMAAVERRAGLDDADARALRSIGIDLDEIVRQAERALGPGALAEQRATGVPRGPFGVAVDTEISPRDLRRGSLRTPPDTGALVRAAIRDDTRAARLLTELNVEPSWVRERLGPV
jgi:hypothetical protein